MEVLKKSERTKSKNRAENVCAFEDAVLTCPTHCALCSTSLRFSVKFHTLGNVPVPMEASAIILNDLRSVSLTYAVMKLFKRPVHNSSGVVLTKVPFSLKIMTGARGNINLSKANSGYSNLWMVVFAPNILQFPFFFFFPDPFTPLFSYL